MPNRIVRSSLLIFDALTGLTAVAGGIALVTGAEVSRFPAEWLRVTPFSDYVVPGLILAVVVGGSACAANVGMLVGARPGAVLSMVAGCVLMGWIGGELLLLRSAGSRSWLEAAYFGVGLLMTALGLIYLRLAPQASNRPGV